jgi:transposase
VQAPWKDVLVQSNGKKKPRTRRAFTPVFKAYIVANCRQGDRTVGQIAQDFDLTEAAVRAWVKR